MQSTIWTYPWDVADVGVSETLDDTLDRAGAGGLSLAVSYHAGRFLQARSPKRKICFPEDGTIYFEPDPSRYEHLLIKPQVASTVAEQGDMLRRLEAERERRGFALHAWTVCLHNTRIGMAYPRVTAANAFGDRHFFSLCPSNPHARAYVIALVADMTHRYHLDSVELESPTFMGVVHGYHHEKDEVGLNARENFLLGLCFCEHCLAGAARVGVNGEQARLEVQRVIAQACARPVPEPSGPVNSPDDFADLPAVRAYLQWRFTPVASLLAEIRAAAHARSRVYLLTGAVNAAWRSGVDLARAVQDLDGLVVLAYDQAPDQAAATVAAARALTGEDKHLSAGFRLAGPAVTGPNDLTAAVRAAARAGARGCNFYNYGLVPAARLDWVRAALAGQ